MYICICIYIYIYIYISPRLRSAWMQQGYFPIKEKLLVRDTAWSRLRLPLSLSLFPSLSLSLSLSLYLSEQQV